MGNYGTLGEPKSLHFIPKSIKSHCMKNYFLIVKFRELLNLKKLLKAYKDF